MRISNKNYMLYVEQNVENILEKKLICGAIHLEKSLFWCDFEKNGFSMQIKIVNQDQMISNQVIFIDFNASYKKIYNMIYEIKK